MCGDNGGSKMKLPSPDISMGSGTLGGKTMSLGSSSAPVSFGGQNYNISAGGNQLTATNISTGKSVSSADITGDKKMGMPSLTAQPGGNGAFSPIQSNGYYQQTPNASTIRSGEGAINSPYDDKVLQRFLAWQKQNGF